MHWCHHGLLFFLLDVNHIYAPWVKCKPIWNNTIETGWRLCIISLHDCCVFPGLDRFIPGSDTFIPVCDRFIPASIPVTETLHLQPKYTFFNKMCIVLYLMSIYYPRPVLAFGYCRCLRLSVCVSVRVRQPSACPRDNSSSVQARITKFGP